MYIFVFIRSLLIYHIYTCIYITNSFIEYLHHTSFLHVQLHAADSGPGLMSYSSSSDSFRADRFHVISESD